MKLYNLKTKKWEECFDIDGHERLKADPEGKMWSRTDPNAVVEKKPEVVETPKAEEKPADKKPLAEVMKEEKKK